MLSIHGRISCRQCFACECATSIQLGSWRLLNDPCYWGSSTPEYLVLGFSKGFTQVNELESGKFEDVPFKKMRPRLGRILKAFGMLDEARDIESQFRNPENPIAFASLIRCSASRIDEKLSAKNGVEVYGCTGALIPKSFKEIPQVIQNCAKQFLFDLPQSIRIVVLLGNGDEYVKNTKQLLKGLFTLDYEEINTCAVSANGRLWIWAAHPSGLNGHFENWISGMGKPGKKFQQAIIAIKGEETENQIGIT